MVLTPRILIFDPEGPNRAAGCRRAFEGLDADVEVYDPSAGTVDQPWDLVILHGDDEDQLPQNSPSTFLLRYSRGGPVSGGFPRAIDEQGLRRDEAAGIVAVIRELPREQWGDGFQAIWADIPEAMLLATLMLHVGIPLPEDLRRRADREYAERERRADARDSFLIDDASRLSAFKTLISVLRQA